MADEKKPSPQGEAPKSAETKDGQGETKKVDTKVQEEAAQERKESGGYD